MPRLELKFAAVPERRGVNPFTKETIVIPGRPPRVRFFEAEQRGTTILYATGGTGEPTRQRKTEHKDEDEAYDALGRALEARRRGGYEPAGPSRDIEGVEPPRKGSALLIDVYFAAGDDRFLDEVLAFDGAAKLAALAKPWFEDPRPFARRALLAYVEEGCAHAGHKALVKRLFKAAEAGNDVELMARFMVAFDRWSRRMLLAVRYDWDPDERRMNAVLGLRNDPLVREKLPRGESAAEFTRATRRYLTRRAFRYFRRLGYRDPQQYRRAVVMALSLYRDEHLATVGRLLSAWGLLHVLYGRSPVLVRHPRGVRLAKGRALSELSPAPLFDGAWDGALEDLLSLLGGAPGRTVRTWALGMLRTRYAAELAALPLPRVKALVLSPHEEAQVLGVELFARLPELDRASIEDWLELLGAENLDVLGAVCDRAAKDVSGARLSLGQCVDLAVSPAAPLAALGLSFLKEKPIAGAADLEQLLRLSSAKVAVVRSGGVQYVAEQLRILPFATAVHARDLCDAQHVDARGPGLLLAQERFGEDVSLWLALTESPYPDVRAFVLDRAERFRAQPPEALSRVLGTALLALSGAANKRKAAKEIAARVEERPSEADQLLPLLGVTLRSIHPAERTVALGALARAAGADDSVKEGLRARFPGLVLSGKVSE